jgi:hypothetical protein
MEREYFQSISYENPGAFAYKEVKHLCLLSSSQRLIANPGLLPPFSGAGETL